jgi:hypothetical protein
LDRRVSLVLLVIVVVQAIVGLLFVFQAPVTSTLAGFLAYDLVLIVPFLQRLPTVAEAQRLSHHRVHRRGGLQRAARDLVPRAEPREQNAWRRTPTEQQPSASAGG